VVSQRLLRFSREITFIRCSRVERRHTRRRNRGQQQTAHSGRESEAKPSIPTSGIDLLADERTPNPTLTDNDVVKNAFGR